MWKNFELIGIMLMIVGLSLFLLAKFSEKFPFLGRLPGDIHYSKDNFHFYFPIVSSIVLSIVLSLVLTVLVNLFWKK